MFKANTLCLFKLRMAQWQIANVSTCFSQNKLLWIWVQNFHNNAVIFNAFCHFRQIFFRVTYWEIINVLTYITWMTHSGLVNCAEVMQLWYIFRILQKVRSLSYFISNKGSTACIWFHLVRAVFFCFLDNRTPVSYGMIVTELNAMPARDNTVHHFEV
jgi:hypothetical protein